MNNTTQRRTLLWKWWLWLKSTAKKYRNVRYNKAKLALIEAGGDNTKNSRPQAVKAAGRNFSRRRAAKPANMPNLEYPSLGSSTSIASRKRWSISNLVGKFSVDEGDRTLVLPNS